MNTILARTLLAAATLAFALDATAADTQATRNRHQRGVKQAAAENAVDPDLQPTVITSTKLEMWTTDTETRAIFEENVIATGSNIRLTCDRLEVTAHSLTEKDGNRATLEKFKSLVATGRVHITQEDREITCGRADILPGEDKLILTQNPVVIDKTGPYTSTGDRLILYRGQRKIEGDNVRTTLPPMKDLGTLDKKNTDNKPVAE